MVKFYVIHDSLLALGEEMGRHDMWDGGQEKRLISHQGPDRVMRKEKMLRAGAGGKLECWNR